MKTQVRFGHFSPDAPAVNIIIDGETVLENVAFREVSDYLTTEAGSLDVDVVPATGGSAIIDATLDLDRGVDGTVLATGELADVHPLVLIDENESIDDRTQVRFVHASPDAPAVDVRVVDGPTLFHNVAFGEASDYIGVDAGTYDVDVLPTGSDDPALSLSDVNLPDGQTVTAVATGYVDDGSLDTTFVTDFSARDQQKAAGR